MQHNIIPKAGQSWVMNTPVLRDRHSSSLTNSLCLLIFLPCCNSCILLQDLIVLQWAPKSMGASKAGCFFSGVRGFFYVKMIGFFFFFLFSDKIATGSFDKTCKLWSTETGQCYHTFRGHSAEIVSSDGCFLFLYVSYSFMFPHTVVDNCEFQLPVSSHWKAQLLWHIYSYIQVLLTFLHCKGR